MDFLEYFFFLLHKIVFFLVYSNSIKKKKELKRKRKYLKCLTVSDIRFLVELNQLCLWQLDMNLFTKDCVPLPAKVKNE